MPDLIAVLLLLGAWTGIGLAAWVGFVTLGLRFEARGSAGASYLRERGRPPRPAPVRAVPVSWLARQQ